MASSLLDSSTFVVEQKRKFFELRSQYRIFDEDGTQLGAVEQRKRSALTFLARLGTDLDVALPVTLEVVDATGTPLLTLHKPWMRMTLQVSRPGGLPVGTIRKRIKLGKATFGLADPAGLELGEVRGTGGRATSAWSTAPGWRSRR